MVRAHQTLPFRSIPALLVAMYLQLNTPGRSQLYVEEVRQSRKLETGCSVMQESKTLYLPNVTSFPALSEVFMGPYGVI